MNNKMKINVSGKEYYLGQENDSKAKNGFGFYDLRGELLIGTFKNDVFEGYGISVKSSMDLAGSSVGLFKGNKLNGLGLVVNDNKTKFGYFNNGNFESGITFNRYGVFDFSFIKHPDYLIRYMDEEEGYVCSLLSIQDGYTTCIENAKVKWDNLQSTAVLRDIQLRNSLEYYEIGAFDFEGKYYNGQTANGSIRGYGVILDKDNWTIIKANSHNNYRKLIDKENDIYTFDLYSCTLTLYENDPTKAVLKFSNFQIIIEDNVFSLVFDNSIIDDGMYKIEVNSNYEIKNKYIKDDKVTTFEKDIKFHFNDNKTYEYDLEAENKLNNLIGLSNVKKKINRIKSYAVKNKDNHKKMNIHMAFLGNPGTGKTTVAKMVADIFYKYGILPTPKMVNANRRMLVGAHIGHTAIKTHQIINEAMGGVLLVDEAYALDGKSEKDFGKEAIGVLLKEMEDKKGDFCCILAGYTKEMNNLFDINPGFKSRIQYIIDFEDYNVAELKLITLQQIAKNKLIVSNEVLDKIISILSFQKQNTSNFGNARDVVNIIEQLAMIATDRSNFNDDILLEDIAVYMKENTLIEKHVHKAPDLDFNKLQAFYKANNKPIKYKKDNQNNFESVVNIFNTYDHSKIKRNGFIISPDGYAITVGLNKDECISSNATRHIYDRIGNKIEVSSVVNIVKENNNISLIKLLSNNDNIYSYVPLVEEASKIKFNKRKVVVLGSMINQETMTMNKDYDEKISRLILSKNKKDFYLETYNKYTFMPGSLVIDYNNSYVIGIVLEGNKVITVNNFINVINSN